LNSRFPTASTRRSIFLRKIRAFAYAAQQSLKVRADSRGAIGHQPIAVLRFIPQALSRSYQQKFPTKQARPAEEAQ
jgi:hypothetical protein